MRKKTQLAAVPLTVILIVIGGISNVDTENAQSVTNIKVNEYDGICVIKDGFVHVAWGDTDHLVFLSVMSNCLDEEKVLALAEATKIL